MEAERTIERLARETSLPPCWRALYTKIPIPIRPYQTSTEEIAP